MRMSSCPLFQIHLSIMKSGLLNKEDEDEKLTPGLKKGSLQTTG